MQKLVGHDYKDTNYSGQEINANNFWFLKKAQLDAVKPENGLRIKRKGKRFSEVITVYSE
jgi:hypothetical protein